MTTLAEQIAALNLPPIPEDEMPKFLGLSPAQYEKHKATITDDDRAFFHQARAIEILSGLWQSGVEPYPSDVSVNRGRKKRGKR